MMMRYIPLAALLVVLAAGCAGTSEVQAPQPPAVPPKEYPVNEIFDILPDRVVQGTDKEAKAISPTQITTTYYPGERTWTLKQDVSRFPGFTAPQMPILEAVYNLSLEEAVKNIKKEGTLMAGEKWTGVWTRDISYAIHLALGIVLPENSMNSLKFKVNSQEQVIQDTGTGGSWPISTDRVVWAIAAWDIYLTSGNREWLDYSYRILKNTAEKDLPNAVDPENGLYYGESSFMDWREQTYPKWMEPKDIYEAKALGTNVLHRELHQILATMARELGRPAVEAKTWQDRADALTRAINKEFWLEQKGYFSVYQYPKAMGRPLSDKTESLGNALAVYFGVTDPARSARIMENLPVVPFGPPIIYPQHAHANPYHNKAVWPFVTAYYGLAGQKAGNLAAVDFALRSNLRVAALMLTNKENFTFDKGDYRGTAINSDRQLWSVGGQLAGYYRILFGLTPRVDGLAFSPAVPTFVQGPLSLTGYPYRGAKVDITVQGQGTKIASLKVDGVEKGPDYRLPITAQGTVKVEIVLESGSAPGRTNLSPLTVGPRDPQGLKGTRDAEGRFSLTWRPQPGVALTSVFKNGLKVGEAKEGAWTDPSPEPGVYYLQSVDERGGLGNYSEYFYSMDSVKVDVTSGTYPTQGLRKEDGGATWVEIAKGEGVNLSLTVEKAGTYSLAWVYGNNNGPISTDNKCGIRTLMVNGRPLGTQVFPHRGGGERWGLSNSLTVSLTPGTHRVELVYLPVNENMNIDVNEADLVRLEARLLP